MTVAGALAPSVIAGNKPASVGLLILIYKPFTNAHRDTIILKLSNFETKTLN